jgi:hypothetical protein
MRTTNQPSESLIGSLCLEAAGVRQRWRQLSELLTACREERLILRLQSEARRLRERRQELQDVARQLAALPLRDRLGVAFLMELTDRP